MWMDIKGKFYTQLLKVILAFLAPQVVTSDPVPYESSLRQAVHQSQKCRAKSYKTDRNPSWRRYLSLPILPLSMKRDQAQYTLATCNHRKSFTSFYIHTTKIESGYPLFFCTKSRPLIIDVGEGCSRDRSMASIVGCEPNVVYCVGWGLRPSSGPL